MRLQSTKSQNAVFFIPTEPEISQYLTEHNTHLIFSWEEETAFEH